MNCERLELFKILEPSFKIDKVLSLTKAIEYEELTINEGIYVVSEPFKGFLGDKIVTIINLEKTMNGHSGDILYMVDYPLERTRAIILNRYLSQHNDFINYMYLKEKDEKLLDLLDSRCWWLESWCNRYLDPIVQSNFLYEHIEGVENEKT